ALFCQLDVTGRSEPDPAAEALAANILRYVAAWKPPASPGRRVVYAGGAAGRQHLEAAGVGPAEWEGGDLSANDQVLVVGPGGGAKLADRKAAVARFLEAGGNVLAIAVSQEDADACLPVKVTLTKAQYF